MNTILYSCFHDEGFAWILAEYFQKSSRGRWYFSGRSSVRRLSWDHGPALDPENIVEMAAECEAELTEGGGQSL